MSRVERARRSVLGSEVVACVSDRWKFWVLGLNLNLWARYIQCVVLLGVRGKII
jgi:hypothetical protein